MCHIQSGGEKQKGSRETKRSHKADQPQSDCCWSGIMSMLPHRTTLLLLFIFFLLKKINVHIHSYCRRMEWLQGVYVSDIAPVVGFNSTASPFLNAQWCVTSQERSYCHRFGFDCNLDIVMTSCDGASTSYLHCGRLNQVHHMHVPSSIPCSPLPPTQCIIASSSRLSHSACLAQGSFRSVAVIHFNKLLLFK